MLVAFAVIASTSEKCAASFASNPNAVSESVTMSAVKAKSSPEAAAKDITPDMPFSMSSVFQPACAMYLNAAADSVALNFVSAPISLAFSFKSSISEALALDIACTSDIPSSKSAPILIAAPPNPARAVPALAMAVSVPLIPDWAIPVSFDNPALIPLASRSVSITTFPSAI